MGNITISIAASVEVNGVVQSNSGTVSISCKGFTRQTRDFTDGFEEVASSISSAYFIVLNTGDESLFVQFANSTPNYLVFEVVAGAHGVWPMSLYDGAPFNVLTASIRSATAAGSRGVIIIAKTS